MGVEPNTHSVDGVVGVASSISTTNCPAEREVTCHKEDQTAIKICRSSHEVFYGRE